MFEVKYYREGSENPVNKFIAEELNTDQQGRLAKYVKMLEEQGYELKRPYVEKLKGYTDLWELRPNFWNVEIRIIFTWYKNTVVFLEGFFEKNEGKKTQRHYDRANDRKNKLPK